MDNQGDPHVERGGLTAAPQISSLSPSAGPGGYWQAPFFTIWTGQVFSLLGSSLAGFALIWWLTKATGSATMLATATLFSMLPQVFLGPLAGTLVDRWSRRRVMIVADSAIALVSLGLAYLFFTGKVQIWMVFIVMMLRSIGGSFHYPAMGASTSLMVPEKHLARVAGMNQTLQGVMNIISPTLGALLIASYPIAGILLLDVVTAVIAVVPLFFIKVPQPPRSTARQVAAGQGRPNQHSSVWQEFAAGLKYVTAWKGMLLLLIMATVLNFLLTPSFSLLPLLVTRHFNGQAWHLGLLESAFGIGVVVGGLTLSAWGGFKKRIATSMMGVVGMGLGVGLIGLAPGGFIWLAVAGMAVTGFMNPLANGPLSAVMQACVAKDMQGRVFLLVNSLSSLMSPLSLAVAGPISDLAGIQVWFVVGGAMCLLMAIAGLNTPVLMGIEDGHRIEPAAEPASAIGD